MADNKLQSLSEIFNQKIFRIPDYQRGYSWQNNQLVDFWDDLQNLKDGKFHYTGLLTIAPIKKEDIEKLEKWQDDLWLLERGSMKAYHLVDGQQRLTTAIIFIQQLLQHFKEDEWVGIATKQDWQKKFLYQTYKDKYQSYMFGYEKDNPSNEYFKAHILGQTSLDHTPEETLYTANLKKAKEFFTKKLKSLDEETMENLFQNLTTNFKFNVYEIDDELDTFVTFETMNNRGKPLSNLELLKNRLIYLTTLLKENNRTKNKLRRDINNVWKTIYEFLGKKKDRPLDDDTFLRNHWIMYFGYDRSKSEAYAKNLLKERFTPKKVQEKVITYQEIANYIQSLAECVKSWFYLFNADASTYRSDTREWFEKLNRVGVGAFAPLLMAVITKCDEAQTLDVLKAAERFVFLVFKLSQRSSHTKNNHFYGLANKFYHETDNCDIQTVLSDIKWQAAGEKGTLGNEDYEYHGWFDLNRFKQYIIDRFEKYEGYYSWNGLKYFLYEYEQHLQAKSQGNTKINWSEFDGLGKGDTIEHIYPQAPEGDCWQTSYQGFSKKESKRLLHSLGNLLLLSRAKNSELQNHCFDYKKKHKNKEGNEVGFFNGSYSEIEVASHQNWTSQEILKRGIHMLEFLAERWEVDFASWHLNTVDLLQLEFLQKKV